MTVEANKDLLARFVAELNDGDLRAFDDLLSDDYINHEGGDDALQGRDGLREVMRMLRAAMPDLRVNVHDVIAEGDRIVARLETAGTHQGELMGIAPTGRFIRTDGIDIWRIRDGRLVEHWGVTDTAGMVRQLTAPG